MSWAKELFGEKLLVKAEGKIVEKPSDEVVAGKKFIILYFSASWCGPCRKFTPLLTVCYEDIEDKDEVEVVFVSNDSDQEGFDDYFEEMPWASIAFGEDAKREGAGEKFGVQGIPRVVVLNAADGSVVNGDARALITAKKTISGLTWA